MSQVMTAEEREQSVNAAPAENGKKKLTENTSLAAKILALCIAVSFFVIGPMKLSGMYKKAERVFKYGNNAEYTVSVYNDIMTSANSASILAGLAEAELGKTDDVKELGKLAKDLVDEDDADDLIEDFIDLVQISNTVYSAYEKSAGEVSKDAERAIRNINNARTTVSNDSYWTYAADFNAARKGFPGAIMGLIGGTHKLPDKLG